MLKVKRLRLILFLSQQKKNFQYCVHYCIFWLSGRLPFFFHQAFNICDKLRRKTEHNYMFPTLIPPQVKSIWITSVFPLDLM